MAVVTAERWHDAQSDELNFWNRRTLARGDVEPWLAAWGDEISGLCARHGVGLAELSDVLQIGVGPCDVIDFMRTGNRVALDPLSAMFREEYRQVQDPRVQRVSGRGERLPFPPESFDLVIVRNCLDHVQAPEAVVAEAARVLRPGGLAYVWCHVYSRFGCVTHRLTDRLGHRNLAHPWTFTRRDLKTFLGTAGLALLEEGKDGLCPRFTWARLRPRSLARLLLGHTARRHYLLASKPGGWSGRHEDGEPRAGFASGESKESL